MKKVRYEKGNIVVIGGDAESHVVRWVEHTQTYGLYTGFEVVDVLDDNRIRIAGYTGIVHDDNVIAVYDLVENFFEYTKIILAKSDCDIDINELKLDDIFVSKEKEPERFEMITIASDKSFYEACDMDEAYEYILESSEQDFKIFMPNTNLLFKEVKNMNYDDEVTVTVIKDSGEHMLFTGLAPYQALWMDERITEDEYINIFRSSDAISKRWFLELRRRERDRQGIEIFGADIWIVVQEYLSMYEYDVIFRTSNKVTVLDLQCSDNDGDIEYNTFISNILSTWKDRLTYEEEADIIEYYEETSLRLGRYLKLQESKIIKDKSELVNCDIEERVTFEDVIYQVEEIHKTINGTSVILQDSEKNYRTVYIPR